MTTKPEVLAMAEQAGIKYRHTPVGTNEMWCYDDAILRFAALVAAAEREECAKVCDANGNAAYERAVNAEKFNPRDPAYYSSHQEGISKAHFEDAKAIRARSAK